ncbi:kinase-like domain-containing protein [Bombardia bombarda]|uniref:Kinase-like domain-containing protein n=1 Tax=Bombardia bombarda TaxID=252184 RepID=A0AA39WBT5_9PEZI|nr:kinase-like domain-containing protein [Bombardia bombarda]
MSTTSSTASTQPRRSAMKPDATDSDRTQPLGSLGKAVQIAEPEPPAQPLPHEESPLKKQITAGLAKRLHGRPPLPTSSRASVASLGSEGGGSLLAAASPSVGAEDSPQVQPHSHHRHRLDRASEKLVSQLAEWLQREKTKRETKMSLKLSSRRKPPPLGRDNEPSSSTEPGTGRARAPSVDSQSSEVSLDRLQRILDDSMSALGLNNIPAPGPHLGRRHHRKSAKSLSLTRTVSSDTEFFDGDVVVPSCDAFLDNSKTMSYSGGKAIADDTVSLSSRKEEKEKQAWLSFKNEIIRLAHTLKLRGWRRVPLNSGDAISVERLSGALTNAVYVVSPPPESVLPPQEGKKQPTKVLLRIYGPQVEHLIDREKELSVLRRLARKKIGPRMLGTFLNGRFEQFFNATTLTPPNLREPETSKQIAKRMRELHDGVELLEEEKDEGPSVWMNWVKWLEQAEKTVMFLDKQLLTEPPQGAVVGPKDAWKTRGFVCGVEWAAFKAMVQKYRKFLDDYYGNRKRIRDKLVFAHNDTQYGNILRIRPDDKKSPLLQPANEHKQLIVIDFEYAAANVAGYEFANHFSEWTYNYHDAVAPYACDTSKYPDPEQQRRFIKAYVEHRPRVPGSSTPKMAPQQVTTPSGGTPALHSTSSASSIVEFMLDARIPPGAWKEEEARREEESEKRIQELMEETRIWRIANSAQWVAWGIVQAKIPGLKLLPNPEALGGGDLEEGEEGDDAADEDDAFDYLSYAQERAFFFWGDCVLMGLVKPEELPAELVARLKTVRH